MIAQIKIFLLTINIIGFSFLYGQSINSNSVYKSPFRQQIQLEAGILRMNDSHNQITKVSLINPLSKKSINKLKRYVIHKNKKNSSRLNSFNKNQERFFKKLCKVNPQQADALYFRWALNKKQLENDLESSSQNKFFKNTVYNSFHDSLISLTSFWQTNQDSSLSNSAQNISNNLESSIKNQKTISNYMHQQNEVMKKVTDQSPELRNSYRRLSKDAYYSIQENKYLDEYLKHDKIFREELLDGLSHQIGFQEYFSNHNTLKGLFNKPENWGMSADGLQTNKCVKQAEQYVYNKLSTEVKNKIGDQIKTGNKEINKIKTKFPYVKNLSDLPSFKPNPLKGKPFKDRVHSGFDFQFEKQNNYVPTGIIIGVNTSYQLILNGYTGLGIAYRVRFGNSKDYNNSKGVTIRSFIDYQFINNLFFSGGYEIYSLSDNEKKINEFNIPFKNNWFGFDGYESFLLGLKLKTKISKIGALEYSLQIDILHDQHSHNTPLVVYRFGWGF